MQMERAAEKAMQISKSSDGHLQRIKMALAQMAIFRQATLDASTLKLYSARLATERLDDVTAALEKLQEMERAEGEPTLPAMSTILAMIRYCAVQRENRERIDKKPFLVGIECPACRHRSSGFVAQGETIARPCPRCSQPMQEFARVRASEVVA